MTTVIQSSYPVDVIIQDILPPVNNYKHSIGIDRRQIKKVVVSEGGLISTEKPAQGATFNFVEKNIDTSFINLAESYFSISGNILVTQTETELEGIFEKHYTRDMMKCSQLWLLSLFRSMALKIDDKEIEMRNIPILMNDFLYIYENHHRDLECKTYNQNGFHVGNHFTSPAIKIKAEDELTAQSFIQNNYNNLDCDYNICDFDIKSKLNKEALVAGLKVPFTYYIPLKLLFSIKDLVPVYNRQIQISLVRDNSDDLSIFLDPKYKVEINNFDKFQLDLIQYTLNDTFKAMMDKNYKKPMLQVINVECPTLVPLRNQEPNNTISVQTPIKPLFGMTDLHICFPKITSNVIPTAYNIASKNPTNYTTRYNSKWSNTPPHCFMPVPISKLMVSIDSYEFINKTFQDEDIKLNVANQDKNIITPICYDDKNNVLTGNYYTLLYHNMLLCRKYHGTLEDSIKPEQFYRDKFIVSIPTEHFSRVNTNGLLTVELTLPNYTLDPFIAPADADTTPTADATKNITQMLIIQHGKKAVMFKADGVDVSNATANIKNDIEYE